MSTRWNHWIGSAADATALLRRAWPWAAAAMYWFVPSSGVAKAMLWGAGVYALWNWRKTLAAWKNPVGVFFGLGVLWALISVAWSFDPAGTARDLLKSAPMALAVLAIPAIFDRPGRIWTALEASAGLITARLAVDLIRIFFLLGWPSAFAAARYLHPYLYTHPNVSSMMAGLCVLVLAARSLAGGSGWGRKALLAVGIALDLAYLVVLASRGPQVVFALVALAFPLVLLPGWRTRLVAAVLAGALAFLLWEALPKINPRFRDRTMVNLNQRTKIWRHARQLAHQQPILGYGFGKKSFVKALYENPAHRAPRVPFQYPHAHSYWLMLYFQGGAVGFALWSLGWLALGLRLGRRARQAEQAAAGWRGRVQARVLPALLGAGLAFILIYGLGDYPDNMVRHAQFYLAGLAVAWIYAPAARKECAA
jgi:O-antigen ligase